jgi:hypothetical protein
MGLGSATRGRAPERSASCGCVASSRRRPQLAFLLPVCSALRRNGGTKLCLCRCPRDLYKLYGLRLPTTRTQEEKLGVQSPLSSTRVNRSNGNYGRGTPGGANFGADPRRGGMHPPEIAAGRHRLHSGGTVVRTTTASHEATQLIYRENTLTRQWAPFPLGTEGSVPPCAGRQTRPR